MDLKQLKYVIAIAQEQNITHAAEKLFITRSALNYSLLKLEKDLGFPLFKRVQNRLLPTYAGELYLAQARQILTSCHELSHTMQVLSDETCRRIHIGITIGGGQQTLMQIFPDFHRKYPNVTVHLVEGNSKILEDALLEGSIDIAWSCSIPTNPLLDYILIRPQNSLKLAVPYGHPLLTKHPLQDKQNTVVDLRLFKDESFILMNTNSFVRRITDEYFHYAGFKPHIMMECSIMQMAAHFVSEGVALAFVPADMYNVKQHAFLFDVEPQKLKIASTILYRKGTLFTEVENDLIKRIVDLNR